MAVNSKREQIIVYVKDQLEGLSSINSVVRTKQSRHQLKEFALTQLPVAAVVGRMPKESNDGVTTHISTRSCVDVIISDLKIDVYVYAQELVSPDTLISNLADDVWALLYADQKMDGLTVGLKLELSEEHEYWDPFVAFQLTVVAKYQHSTGGI